jgi:tetratricopeptide (TPR) repeat protein
MAAAREAKRLVDVDPGRAREAAALAVRGAVRAGDQAAAALAEQALGHSLLQTAELDAAIRHLRRAATHGERAATWDVVASVRTKLAYAMVQRGRLTAALHEIDAAVDVLGGAEDTVARAQRAVIRYHAGRLDDALADYQAVIPRLRRSDDRLNLQKALVNRGVLLAARHEFTAAVADLTEADRLARLLGRDLVVGIIAEDLGFTEILRGDVPAALAHLDRAERIVVAHHGQLAPVLQDRGALLLSVGLVSEAREVAGRAVLAFRREQRQLRVPEMRLLLAQAAFADGDLAGARREATEAGREFRRQQRAGWTELAQLTALRARVATGDTKGIGAGRIESIVDALVRSGWPAATLEARLVAARLLGDTTRAHAHLRLAGAHRRRGPAVLRARAWYAEALLRADTGDRRGAATATRTGLRILDEHAAALGATDLRAHSAAHRRDLAELGLRAAIADGRPARIFAWAERGRASRLLFRPVRPPDDPELANLLVEVRQAAKALDTGVTRSTHRQVVLERRIRDHCRLHGYDAGPGRSGPVALSALRAGLGEHALVQFVQLDGSQHALTLTDGRLRWRTLGPVAATAALLERLPFALHRMARHTVRAESRVAALALLRDTAARLDALLLGPLPELADRPLVIVPTGPLHSLPWSILPSCAGRPVSVAPSATLWHETATRPHHPADGVLVAAGPNLTGAHDEAVAVAAIHDTTPLVGAAATTAVVLAGFDGAGLVHLAAHGRLSHENPLFSSLLLHDGPLVGYDLERLARLPDTVVLAACDSGRSMVLAGDELLGLGATFLTRGTAALIASVVPVPDAETAPLMVALHHGLADGQSPADALAAAQRDVPTDDLAAVAAAAGFVCLGASRSAGGEKLPITGRPSD